MTTKMQHARDLFFNSGKTQKDIALEVGVSERTIQYWVKQNQWQRLREASYHMPAIISDNLSMQIVELQNDVNSREAGKRYPTIQEAEILRKMINALEKMKRYPSLAMCQQVFQSFRDYIRPDDNKFPLAFHNYEERFLTARAVNGFQPWEVEYAATHLAPADTKDETELPVEEITIIPDVLAPQSQTCLPIGQVTNYKSQIPDALAPQSQITNRKSQIPDALASQSQTCLPIGQVTDHKSQIVDFVPQPAITLPETLHDIEDQMISDAVSAFAPPEMTRKNPQGRTPRIVAFRKQSGQ